jgi:hypothetical protein
MTKKLSHKFVKNIPEQLENGVVYISIEYATAIHKCCCECGNQVVTPLSPTDWKLTFDGETVSLYPSIGNWNFPCQSHYWIRNNMVSWASKITKEQIAVGREGDQMEKEVYYKKKKRRSLLDILKRK